MVAQLNYISWSLSTYVSNIWDLLELLFDPRPKSSNTDLLSRPDLILSSHTSRAGLQVLTLFWCKLVDHLSGWRIGNIGCSLILHFFKKKGCSLTVDSLLWRMKVGCVYTSLLCSIGLLPGKNCSAFGKKFYETRMFQTSLCLYRKKFITFYSHEILIKLFSTWLHYLPA